MSGYAGQFIWYELMTSDHDASLRFYGEVLGLHATDAKQPSMRYTVLSAGGTKMEDGVGGVMDIPTNMEGAPSTWMAHIAVDDVDASAKRIESLGGKIHRPPTDIPNGIGRFSVVGDPQGNGFMLFRPNMPEGAQPPKIDRGQPGRIGWHELATNDWQRAFVFYSELFGWKKSTSVDMGTLGTYQVFAINGEDRGGMMNRPPNAPVPNGWRFFFNVPAVTAALERIKKAGGKALTEALPVPGGQFVANCVDPQGAYFSLVGDAR